MSWDDDDQITEFETEEEYDGPQPPYESSELPYESSERRWSKRKIAAGLAGTAALAGGAYYTYNNPEQLTELPNMVSDAASTAWEGTKSGISSAYNDHGAAMSAIGSGITSGYSSAKDGVSSLYSAGSDLVSSNMPSAATIASYGKGLGQGAASLGSSALETAKSWMPSSVGNFAMGVGKQIAQEQAAKELQSAAGLG